MTTILLSRTHYPVTTLGPGLRAGIWTQGCTLACPGCLARDTWAADPGRATDVTTVLGWVASLTGPVEGVTISGGEPFEQPAALEALLRSLHAWRAAAASGRGGAIDILVYSGFSLSRLSRTAGTRRLLELCDAVVAGPYVDRLNTGLRWRGSANQRIVPFTELGHARYSTVDQRPRRGPDLQVAVDRDRIWYIGIPRRGDLSRLNERLAAAGVTRMESSWDS
jgi:anaerobic ribonucleoside-triphosphate reductase activating protein